MNLPKVILHDGRFFLAVFLAIEDMTIDEREELRLQDSAAFQRHLKERESVLRDNVYSKLSSYARREIRVMECQEDLLPGVRIRRVFGQGYDPVDVNNKDQVWEVINYLAKQVDLGVLHQFINTVYLEINK